MSPRCGLRTRDCATTQSNRRQRHVDHDAEGGLEPQSNTGAIAVSIVRILATWLWSLALLVPDVASAWIRLRFDIRLGSVSGLRPILLAASDAGPIDYLPIVSTIVAAGFTTVLYRHWRRNPQARHLLWWMIGAALFGLGTFTEATTTLAGWNEPVFRAWYIAGALLGGAPLAQGSVYLLMDRRKADRLTVVLVTYIAIAATFVIATPVISPADGRLDGDSMQWGFVRLFSPLINLYAVVFLVGGAIWSAVLYSRRADRPRSRVVGNALIAVGAILPGIGGVFTRLGHVEVLYVMELIGLSLIWAGYRAITADRTVSIHAPQRAYAIVGKET